MVESISAPCTFNESIEFQLNCSAAGHWLDQSYPFLYGHVTVESVGSERCRSLAGRWCRFVTNKTLLPSVVGDSHHPSNRIMAASIRRLDPKKTVLLVCDIQAKFSGCLFHG